MEKPSCQQSVSRGFVKVPMRISCCQPNLTTWQGHQSSSEESLELALLRVRGHLRSSTIFLRGCLSGIQPAQQLPAFMEDDHLKSLMEHWCSHITSIGTSIGVLLCHTDVKLDRGQGPRSLLQDEMKFGPAHCFRRR